jgi:hypothetical protein
MRLVIYRHSLRLTQRKTPYDGALTQLRPSFPFFRVTTSNYDVPFASLLYYPTYLIKII